MLSVVHVVITTPTSVSALLLFLLAIKQYRNMPPQGLNQPTHILSKNDVVQDQNAGTNQATHKQAHRGKKYNGSKYCPPSYGYWYFTCAPAEEDGINQEAKKMQMRNNGCPPKKPKVESKQENSDYNKTAEECKSGPNHTLP